METNQSIPNDPGPISGPGWVSKLLDAVEAEKQTFAQSESFFESQTKTTLARLQSGTGRPLGAVK